MRRGDILDRFHDRAVLDSLTHHCYIIETGHDSRSFKSPVDDHTQRYAGKPRLVACMRTRAP